MRKVFWDNPYQQELHTTITAVKGNQLLLAQTIVYSFSGGQESDKATINGLPIIDSKKEGLLIYYTMPDGHGLKEGDEVVVMIDWVRRLKLMRLHFAAELVLEIVTKRYQLEKVGAHISESKARIDFKSTQNIKTYFDEILSDYNAIIERDLPIQTGFSDETNQRRFWKIDGFAQVPCGGTHVKSTAEVGLVKLKRELVGKGVERIEIRLIN
ncbi:alanyl-tRNA editing protein [Candidatus Berkiella aquae]|uniref:Alanine--tRNA ligase n=1 Tax=Candidatus Berkiella aquae TaxID=295108 RepID=A0A0Q9YK46_9GAMM|nr:alanyl-tRNA editing protein [Candidatus Berkiella aquae]MCS5710026.1 alanyl-tRNA editing protein [Candidatus Berkiella aquae]